MKILYVEDNEMVAVTVCAVLTGKGYEVEHFTLGNLGFARFCQDPQSWDVAIIDLELPDMSGRDLIPKIAAQRPNLPIVVFSGQRGLSDSFDLYSSGAAAVLSKPFGGYDLVEVINRLVQPPPDSASPTQA